MKQYQCTKIVEAARIRELYSNTLILDDGEEILLVPLLKTKFHRMAEEAGLNVEDGYYVKYKDGYVSWSPDDVFEEGYHELVDLSPEELIYNNVESFLRAAIIDLADLKDSNLDVISSMANMIGNMQHALIMKQREREFARYKAIDTEALGGKVQ